jgi:hypothetical protein
VAAVPASQADIRLPAGPSVVPNHLTWRHFLCHSWCPRCEAKSRIPAPVPEACRHRNHRASRSFCGRAVDRGPARSAIAGSRRAHSQCRSGSACGLGDRARKRRASSDVTVPPLARSSTSSRDLPPGQTGPGEVRHCIIQKTLLAVPAIVVERSASNGYVRAADRNPSTGFRGLNERKTPASVPE